jgi:hypothetical protein
MMYSRNPGQAALSRLAGLRAARGAILVSTVLFSLLPFQEAAAHDPGLSSLTVRPRSNDLEATLTLAVKDAAQLAELDDDRDGIVTKAEFAQDQSQLEAVVAAQLIVAPDGKVARPNPSAAVSMKITMLKFIWALAAPSFPVWKFNPNSSRPCRLDTGNISK